MLVHHVAAALLLFLTSPLAPPSDAAFVTWARGRVVSMDPAGRAFRTLDAGVAGARLIGVGESVHEVQPFLTFRFQLLQSLVQRHRVTALVLESAEGAYGCGRRCTRKRLRLEGRQESRRKSHLLTLQGGSRRSLPLDF